MSCWDRVATYHARRPADILPLFRDLPARAAPGAEFRYGDANFILVGLVIEAVTGRAYGDVVTEEVFEPAGLHDTAIEAIDDDPRRLAVGLQDGRRTGRPMATNIYSVPAIGMPDGGMITTAARPGPADRRASSAAACSRPDGGGDDQPAGPNRSDLEQYGYGCELAVVDGAVTIIGHGGGDPGHLGDARSPPRRGDHALGRVQPGPRLVGRHQAPRGGVRAQRATGLTIGFTTVIRLSMCLAETPDRLSAIECMHSISCLQGW